jgi:hypothetical protein
METRTTMDMARNRIKPSTMPTITGTGTGTILATLRVPPGLAC